MLKILQGTAFARLAPWGLALAITLGAVFRLIWGEDIEFKGDEAYTLHFAASSAQGEEPFPWLGMRSSAGFKNPGMSVWAFMIFGYCFEITDAPTLARCVQICSILALIAYIPFIRRLVKEEEREGWYWGVALMALNPLAVILHRKIWPPSLFPLITLAFLLGWLKRGNPWGAFLLGLIAALIGQFQMAGFIMAAAFFFWAILFDRQSVRWVPLIAGALLGTLPMLPWIYEMVVIRDFETPNRAASLSYLLEGMFWLRWIIQPFGLETVYPSLKADFFDFLRYPILFGIPTYWVAIVHLLLIGTVIALAIRGMARLWQTRSQWFDQFTGRSSPTGFTLSAAFWGCGLLFSATLRPFRYHYGLVSMPLSFVWAARSTLTLAKHGRAFLLFVCVGNGLLSAWFLDYIHQNQRKIQGDYGLPYQAQLVHPQELPTYAGKPVLTDRRVSRTGPP